MKLSKTLLILLIINFINFIIFVDFINSRRPVAYVFSILSTSKIFLNNFDLTGFVVRKLVDLQTCKGFLHFVLFSSCSKALFYV